MENILSYFYNINNITIQAKKDYYLFFYRGNKYLFFKIERDNEEIVIINDILKLFARKYYSFIYNIQKSIITIVDNDRYVLIKVNSNLPRNLKEVIIKNQLPIPNNFIGSIDHSNWVYLWSRKNDYYDYQRKHIKNKYYILYSSINYYIGMAETAIAFLVNNRINGNTPKYLSHIRITNNVDDYYNPLNLIIDYKSRDLAEYLKMVFLTEDNYKEISDYIMDNISLTNTEYTLLMARLIYPSIYFDKYDNIVSNKAKEKEIIKIISLTNRYLDFIKYIYSKIQLNNNIPSIDWLRN
ncbi:MAG: hypothetical protein IJH13_00665 [Bacilli bacterium]|nr:hypothetical protein [Bacilli bacterium]